ncbi:MAG: SEC-C domain-containing protein [Bacteroidia bacterium]|nr:SEC-C domain-containing protein [Bacteroidia bacterium]
MILTPNTPLLISDAILGFCRKIVPGEEPIYVDVRPVKDGERMDCFPIVEKWIEKKGGCAAYGWLIWELPTVYVEAEFHSMWESEDGTLLDLTPKIFGCNTVLFLRDRNMRYENKQTDNIRLALMDHAAVHTLLAMAAREFEIMNRGDRAKMHGEIELIGVEAEEFKNVHYKRIQALEEIRKLIPSMSRNDLCICGSGKKYKKCHGFGL